MVDSDGTLRFTTPSGTSGFASFSVTVSDPSGTLPDFPPVTFFLFLGNKIYVDASATGNNNGVSWDSAFLALQDAIAVASPTHEIWVARGTYYPDEGFAETDNERRSTFRLRNEVTLYGGFAGNETDLSERNYVAHPTILSGDIDQNDGPNFANNSENAYHVLTSSDNDSTAILNGFTITSGFANGPQSSDDFGGGLHSISGTPIVENCSFQGNSALFGGAVCNFVASPFLSNCSFLGNFSNFDGGAIYNSNSSPSLTNCFFQENSSVEDGGAIHNFSSSSSLLTNCSFVKNSASSGGAIYTSRTSFSSQTNCIFRQNSAFLGGAFANRESPSSLFTNCTFQANSATFGGAISNFTSSPLFTNCTFHENHADSEGGAIRNSHSSSPTLTNCIIWNNSSTDSNDSTSASVFNNLIIATPSEPTFSHCLVANSGGSSSWNTDLGIDLGNNIDSDPLFVSADGGDLRLLSGSPALNVGDNAANPSTTDLAGNPRFEGAIDLGVFEGAFVTFSHLGFSNPEGDENNNGLTNYAEYALGGDPTAPDNSAILPELTGSQLAFSFRNNAADVVSFFQKSDTLLSDDWEDLILGTDYTLSNGMINGSQAIQTLELSDTLLNNDRLFFRQEFSVPAP